MSDLSLTARPDLARSAPPVNLPVAGIAAALLGLGTLWLAETVSWRQATLFVVGGAMGLVLYHAQFGFTSAFRVFLSDRRGAGLRAQMAMLALACLLFFPALAAGSLFGMPVKGNVDPVGLSVLVGAFLFGIGMQLGAGCASGTLYTVGGGSTRMVITLIFFVAGSALGARHLDWWEATPHVAGISLLNTFGLAPALLLNLAVFAAIAGATVLLERRRHGRLLPANAGTAIGWRRALQGPWPLIAGALALALLNFATLSLAGRPWGITSAFALWGSKLLGAVGLDVAAWPYWASPARAAQLTGSLATDTTSVMDFGIVIGALVAAGLADKFAPVWRIPARSLLAAVVGGMLMGYGARLAYGCNIGAYFSGIASASVHGWVWFAAALAGSYIGTWLRPAFGLAVERTPRQTGC
ncbi:MAG: YeeE/YedE family protein [Pseudomonadota bacterium]